MLPCCGAPKPTIRACASSSPIREEADKIAAREHSRADHSYNEYKRVQAQADSLQADRAMALSSPDRLLSFQVKLNGNYQYPACWIEYKALSTMMPTSIIFKTTTMNMYNAGIQAVLLNETRLYCVNPPRLEAFR
jgi:hypothetical protein